jgi:creatinine deaminase
MRIADRDWQHYAHALEQARLGAAEGGVPIGAALVTGDTVLGVGRNRRVQAGSVIRHGEIDCLENAGRLPAGTYRRATMYTTLSPCSMCAGAVLLYRVPRVVIGERRTFLGAEELLTQHGIEIVLLDDEHAVALMSEFVAARPELWHEDIGS